MYICKHRYRNAIYFPWAQHCFHAHAVEPRAPACTTRESPCREVAVTRKATCVATQKSGRRRGGTSVEGSSTADEADSTTGKS